MRLIDADKLEDHEEIVPFGDGMYESTFVVYKDDIGEAPTIDAIPIEWIKKWGMMSWVKSKKCEYDIIVSKMIDEWFEERCREKENEIN